MNKKILFALEEDSEKEAFARFFKEEGFDVVGITCDGLEAARLYEEFSPAFLVTGMVLTGIDGFELLSRIYSGNSKVKTKTIVLSVVKGQGTIRKAMAYGAEYYMVSPVDINILGERIKSLDEQEKDKGYIQNIRPMMSLEEKISKLFLSVGIPPHIKGYVYLREGVKMAVEDPKIINSITKRLYPSISEKYETTPTKVERAIRHAIEVAWNRNRVESINSVFGIRAYVASEKPTNGEFIALVADKMLLEGV